MALAAIPLLLLQKKTDEGQSVESRTNCPPNEWASWLPSNPEKETHDRCAQPLLLTCVPDCPTESATWIAASEVNSLQCSQPSLWLSPPFPTPLTEKEASQTRERGAYRCCLNPVEGSFLLFRFVWWLDCLLLKEGASAFCSLR